MIKYFFYIASYLFLMISHIKAGAFDSLKMTKLFFSDITSNVKVIAGELVFTIKKGAHCLPLSIKDGYRKGRYYTNGDVPKEGEKIVFPKGFQEVIFVENHCPLTLTLVNKEYSLYASVFVSNLTSFGKGITQKVEYFRIENNKVIPVKEIKASDVTEERARELLERSIPGLKTKNKIRKYKSYIDNNMPFVMTNNIFLTSLSVLIAALAGAYLWKQKKPKK